MSAERLNRHQSRTNSLYHTCYQVLLSLWLLLLSLDVEGGTVQQRKKGGGGLSVPLFHPDTSVGRSDVDPSPSLNLTVSQVSPTAVRIAWTQPQENQDSALSPFNLRVVPRNSNRSQLETQVSLGSGRGGALTLRGLQEGETYRIVLARDHQVLLNRSMALTSNAPDSSGDDAGDAPPYSPYNSYHPYYYYPDYSSPSDGLPSPGHYRPPPPPGPGRGPPPRPFPPPPDFDPGLVRPEEAAIVTMVLVIWVFAVVLFVHRWGKIRMLVPHQPRYAYAEANADKLKMPMRLPGQVLPGPPPLAVGALAMSVGLSRSRLNLAEMQANISAGATASSVAAAAASVATGAIARRARYAGLGAQRSADPVLAAGANWYGISVASNTSAASSLGAGAGGRLKHPGRRLDLPHVRHNSEQLSPGSLVHLRQLHGTNSGSCCNPNQLCASGTQRRILLQRQEERERRRHQMTRVRSKDDDGSVEASERRRRDETRLDMDIDGGEADDRRTRSAIDLRIIPPDDESGGGDSSSRGHIKLHYQLEVHQREDRRHCENSIRRRSSTSSSSSSSLISSTRDLEHPPRRHYHHQHHADEKAPLSYSPHPQVACTNEQEQPPPCSSIPPPPQACFSGSHGNGGGRGGGEGNGSRATQV